MKDADCNVVYIAEALNRHPEVFNGMRDALRFVNVDCRVLDTSNIWVRDWAPIQTPSGFVKFQYKAPGLGYEAYPQLVVPDSVWEPLENYGRIERSDIVLDGGNVVRYGDRVIMTRMVFEHNPGIDPGVLAYKLGRLLEAEIVFIPPEPGDTLGHSDGICKWVDAETVFLNDYRSLRDRQFIDYDCQVANILDRHGIDACPFPYAYHLCPELDEEEFRAQFPDADDQNEGYGYYVNYLQVAGAILYPTFDDLEENTAVEKCLWAAHPDLWLEGIDCSRLSLEGGLCNCVSMSYQIFA
jgi:agmatine deiminase